LRLRKIALQRFTVVEFGVDNKCSNGTGSFTIKVRTDATEIGLTDMRLA